MSSLRQRESVLSSVVVDEVRAGECGCVWVKFSHKDGNHFWWLFRGSLTPDNWPTSIVCARAHQEPQ